MYNIKIILFSSILFIQQIHRRTIYLSLILLVGNSSTINVCNRFGTKKKLDNKLCSLSRELHYLEVLRRDIDIAPRSTNCREMEKMRVAKSVRYYGVYYIILYLTTIVKLLD